MTRYHLTNRTSGLDLGIYEGATAYDAIVAMYADAGYPTIDDAAEALCVSAETLFADIHAVIA
jgi:hypothetical protein